MGKSQVTITLGRSGQRVVKEPWRESEAYRPNVSGSSGIKRSLAESYGTGADYSFRCYSKRMREDASSSNYGYHGCTNGSGVGPKDLRFKLMQKRKSRRVEHEIEERKKKELSEEVSRTIRSMESSEASLPRSTPLSRRAADSPRMDSLGSPYASWTSTGLRGRYPDRSLNSASGVSTPRSTLDELPHFPSMRPMEASRAGGAIISSSFNASRQRVPLSNMTTSTLDSGELIRELPPATGGMPRNPYAETQPITVNSLLQSLGLEKFYINFQAEEIDMVALKQMGEGDLKELGIPMGPRKKMLLALQARAKRPVSQSQMIMQL